MPEYVKRIFAKMVASVDPDTFYDAVYSMCPDNKLDDWPYMIKNFKEKFLELFGVPFDSVDPF